jgi:hypothetical protein
LRSGHCAVEVCKKRVLLPVLTVPIFLGITEIALATAPTVKLTIEGVGLTKPLAVTDCKILELGNVWGGNFLDNSRDPAEKPPHGLRGYDVSFCVQLGENDIRKMYVVRYFPNSVAKQGYVGELSPGWRASLSSASTSVAFSFSGKKSGMKSCCVSQPRCRERSSPGSSGGRAHVDWRRHNMF